MNRLEAAIAELVAALREEVAVPSAHDSELMTVDEARRALGGIARSTLYELIRHSEVRSITVGRRRLIPQSAVGEYVRSRGGGIAARGAKP